MKGWLSGGFGYGLWIGVLVASGFSVVPISSLAWKNEFELSGSKVSKVGLFLNLCHIFFSCLKDGRVSTTPFTLNANRSKFIHNCSLSCLLFYKISEDLCFIYD